VRRWRTTAVHALETSRELADRRDRRDVRGAGTGVGLRPAPALGDFADVPPPRNRKRRRRQGRGRLHCGGQRFESPQLHQAVRESRRDFLRHRIARHSRGLRRRRSSPSGDGRTHLSITRRGPRRLECSYGCGQHDKRSCIAAFHLSRRQRKHTLPDQLRVHPRSDRNGIAWSNRGRQSRWHRPY
jgi:hypothetical protein